MSIIWVTGVKMYTQVEARNKETTNPGDHVSIGLPAIDALKEYIIATTAKVDANRDDTSTNYDEAGDNRDTGVVAVS